MAKENSKMDMAQDKKMAKKAIGMHESQLHGGKKSNLADLKKGGNVKKMAMGGAPTQGGMGGKGGQSRPTMPTQSNAGGAKRGLDRAAAMSGRDMSGKGKPATATTPPTSTPLPVGPLYPVTKMKKGGCTKMARGGGIEVRGKTRGKVC